MADLPAKGEPGPPATPKSVPQPVEQDTAHSGFADKKCKEKPQQHRESEAEESTKRRREAAEKLTEPTHKVANDPKPGAKDRKTRRKSQDTQRQKRQKSHQTQQLTSSSVAGSSRTRSRDDATESEMVPGISTSRFVRESSDSLFVPETWPSPIPQETSDSLSVPETQPPLLIPENLPSPSVSESPTAQYVVRTLPDWYTSISNTSYAMKQLGRTRPESFSTLQRISSQISACERENDPASLESLYNMIRDNIHEAEIALPIDGNVLKKANIFSPRTGLPAIFVKDAKFPLDLKTDSCQLYKRWHSGDFTQDILRGIIRKDKHHNKDRIDPAYRKDHPITANYYGAGDTVLGQWWPTQLCAVRDGVHGHTQGGIFGEKGKGAYSVVLAGGVYKDIDRGTAIKYHGTESKDTTPTESTKHLLKSIELQNEVRVLRSHQLPKSNKYRPVAGLRYDGLYKVKSVVVLSKETAKYQFVLKRCEGQEPIRCGDNAARRPTKFEVQKCMELKYYYP